MNKLGNNSISLEKCLSNIEVIVGIVVERLVSEDSNFWILLDNQAPQEPFPEPTEEQVSKVLGCCLNAIHYQNSPEDKVAHLFYNLIKNHFLHMGIRG